MSEISILGFKPSRQSPDTDRIHWAILVSPSPIHGSERQKSKPRFFSRSSKSSVQTQQQDDSVLLDMHDHQLRQQTYPVPLEPPEEPAASASSSEQTPPVESRPLTTSTSTEDAASPTTSSSCSPSSPTVTATTTNITSPTNEPLPLYLRIKLGGHHSSPPKLTQKLSTLLYGTPTYGPEDDWLRAALDTLIGSGILESTTTTSTNSTTANTNINTNIGVPPSYDAGRVLQFAQEAAKEAIAQLPPHLQPRSHSLSLTRPQAETSELSDNNNNDSIPVLELDYPAHMARVAGVKALFGQHNHSYSLGSPRSSGSLHSHSSSTPSTPRTQSQTRLQQVVVPEPILSTTTPTPTLTPTSIPSSNPYQNQNQGINPNPTLNPTLASASTLTSQRQPQQAQAQQAQAQPQHPTPATTTISQSEPPPPAYTAPNPPPSHDPIYTYPSTTPAPAPAPTSAPCYAPFRATPTPTPTPTRSTQPPKPTPTPTKPHHKSKSTNTNTNTPTTTTTPQSLSRRYKSFLGLRISPSPHACRRHAGPPKANREKWTFERQDDPYAGLM